MEIGGKSSWISISNLSSFTEDKIITMPRKNNETFSVYETDWDWILTHIFKENSLTLSPKYKSS